MPSFVSGAKIPGTDEKLGQGQMLDSLVVISFDPIQLSQSCPCSNSIGHCVYYNFIYKIRSTLHIFEVTLLLLLTYI
jgi:hypothetical protein